MKSTIKEKKNCLNEPYKNIIAIKLTVESNSNKL